MKRVCAVLFAVSLLTLLSGCARGERGREPENTVLVEVLGIDWQDGIYTLTAAGRNGAGETVTQSVEGVSTAEIFSAMPGAGETWFSLTGVNWFLFGDGVEPGEILSFILKESGMSWRATVWYTPIAEGFIKETADGGQARLTVLEQSGTETVTVLDALAELSAEGKTKLPALTIRNGMPEFLGMLQYEHSGKGVEET